MQKIRRRQFGEILIAEGVISQEQLSAALELQRQTGQTVGEILHESGAVTEAEIVRAICIQYQIPFIRLEAYQLTSSLVNQFEGTFLYRHRIMPLDRIGSASLVALGEIPSEQAEQEIHEKLGNEVHFYLAPASEIEGLLREHFSLSPEAVLAIDRERCLANAGGIEAGEVVIDSPEIDNLGSSWEDIFDEAQKNVENG